MREKHTISRREFIKTLGSAAGIAGGAVAGLGVVMKAMVPRNRRTPELSVGKDYCEMCTKCAACPGGTTICRIRTCVFNRRKGARAQETPRPPTSPGRNETCDACVASAASAFPAAP